METQSTTITKLLSSQKAIIKNYPVLSVRYGSPYGNRRTAEENLLVLQQDRQLTQVYQN